MGAETKCNQKCHISADVSGVYDLHYPKIIAIKKVTRPPIKIRGSKILSAAGKTETMMASTQTTDAAVPTATVIGTLNRHQCKHAS